jgi:hypothetical protein
MRATSHRVALLAGLLAASGCTKKQDTAPPDSAGAASEPAKPADDALEDPEEESPYLDVSNFNDVVESHLPEVITCYRETAGKTSTTGRVKATFVINADGRAKQVTFDAQRSTLKDPALEACIRGKAAEWKFNISLTGADTPMPYTFDFSESGLLKP